MHVPIKMSLMRPYNGGTTRIDNICLTMLLYNYVHEKNMYTST